VNTLAPQTSFTPPPQTTLLISNGVGEAGRRLANRYEHELQIPGLNTQASNSFEQLLVNPGRIGFGKLHDSDFRGSDALADIEVEIDRAGTAMALNDFILSCQTVDELKTVLKGFVYQRVTDNDHSATVFSNFKEIDDKVRSHLVSLSSKWDGQSRTNDLTNFSRPLCGDIYKDSWSEDQRPLNYYDFAAKKEYAEQFEEKISGALGITTNQLHDMGQDDLALRYKSVTPPENIQLSGNYKEDLNAYVQDMFYWDPDIVRKKEGFIESTEYRNLINSIDTLNPALADVLAQRIANYPKVEVQSGQQIADNAEAAPPVRNLQEISHELFDTLFTYENGPDPLKRKPEEQQDFELYQIRRDLITHVMGEGDIEFGAVKLFNLKSAVDAGVATAIENEKLKQEMPRWHDVHRILTTRVEDLPIDAPEREVLEKINAAFSTLLLMESGEMQAARSEPLAEEQEGTGLEQASFSPLEQSSERAGSNPASKNQVQEYDIKEMLNEFSAIGAGSEDFEQAEVSLNLDELDDDIDEINQFLSDLKQTTEWNKEDVADALDQLQDARTVLEAYLKLTGEEDSKKVEDILAQIETERGRIEEIGRRPIRRRQEEGDA